MALESDIIVIKESLANDQKAMDAFNRVIEEYDLLACECEASKKLMWKNGHELEKAQELLDAMGEFVKKNPKPITTDDLERKM